MQCLPTEITKNCRLNLTEKSHDATKSTITVHRTTRRIHPVSVCDSSRLVVADRPTMGRDLIRVFDATNYSLLSGQFWQSLGKYKAHLHPESLNKTASKARQLPHSHETGSNHRLPNPNHNDQLRQFAAL